MLYFRTAGDYVNGDYEIGAELYCDDVLFGRIDKDKELGLSLVLYADEGMHSKKIAPNELIQLIKDAQESMSL